MNHQAIPLNAVRDALMFAKVRCSSVYNKGRSQPLARFAAYTEYPDNLGSGCQRKRPALEACAQLNFGLMERGNLLRLLERVRLNGLPEVRATWGCGLRALKAEFADRFLR